MYVCVCMYVWMDGCMDGWMHPDGWMHGWMDASGWMDGWMHACMHGPVSRVPEWGTIPFGGGQERELGGPYHGGGARDPGSGLIYTLT